MRQEMRHLRKSRRNQCDHCFLVSYTYADQKSAGHHAGAPQGGSGTMTCIVGVKDGEQLWIGGDSAASCPANEVYNFAGPKVFAAGEYLVGYTISFRAGQVLQHEVDWPSPPADFDLERLMVRDVVPKLRHALREAGALKVTEGVEETAQFMIGLRGELVTVGGDFSIGYLREPYLAIGSGRHNAYGALHALADSNLSGEQRVRRALEAAVNFTGNVRPPFVILSNGV
jgi:ATP-dependent protease HslVU (ClpYQ) peptidase subunit